MILGFEALKLKCCELKLWVLTVHKIARFHDGSLPLAPTAVHIRTSGPPRRFEPFHRLGVEGNLALASLRQTVRKQNMSLRQAARNDLERCGRWRGIWFSRAATRADTQLV